MILKPLIGNSDPDLSPFLAEVSSQSIQSSIYALEYLDIPRPEVWIPSARVPAMEDSAAVAEGSNSSGYSCREYPKLYSLVQ